MNRIVRWDGGEWSPLVVPGHVPGTGLNADVLALTSYDAALVASGTFTNAGGEILNGIASWDGRGWTPWERGSMRRSEPWAVYDGSLVAGGLFTEAGGVSRPQGKAAIAHQAAQRGVPATSTRTLDSTGALPIEKRAYAPDQHLSPEEDEMAYGIVHHFADGTKEEYEASIAAVHPSRMELPEGQIFHAAGPGASGGWTIVALHTSKESWERFRDAILMPALTQGIDGGFTSAPQEQTFEVDTRLP